jgi:excisionase family DNA binding protein
MSIHATIADPIYTTKDLAEILQVSRRSVQWMIKHRRLKAVRIGNGYRVRQSAINEFFDTYEMSTTDEETPG